MWKELFAAIAITSLWRHLYRLGYVCYIFHATHSKILLYFLSQFFRVLLEEHFKIPLPKCLGPVGTRFDQLNE